VLVAGVPIRKGYDEKSNLLYLNIMMHDQYWVILSPDFQD
jgi:hypothetical protein